MIKKILVFLFVFLFAFTFVKISFAQTSIPLFDNAPVATVSTQIATPAAQKEPKLNTIDLTKPDSTQTKEFIKLFNKRPINEPNFINFMGFTIQYAIRSGVPANTIILILLLPFLATLVVFFRQIIGLPTLEMLVPIALSITFVATGIFVGAILLATILFSSIVARLLLKKIRIMQLPKMALSMFLVSLFVFMALVVSTSLRLFNVAQLSFLPVILFILLSDKIVALQLSQGSRPAIVITIFTLILGAIGYLILSFAPIRNYILLYPEIILVLIPINIVMGRYFGLRLTEFHRFAAFRRYVNQ